MRREWEPEELIAAWTLLDGDWELVGNKTGATRLSLLLKFFELEGRFPDLHRRRRRRPGRGPGPIRVPAGHRSGPRSYRRDSNSAASARV
jgi:hypothetical protein